MVSSKVEDACYWTAELICSGHYAEIWDTIFLFYGKYVHVANPKLAIYINTKMSKFKENMNNASTAQEQLDFRNEPAFRHMICEIVITLCQSDKKFVLNYASVPEGDFELVTLKNNLTASDFSRAEKIIKPEDPRELMVTINELQLCLTSKVSSTTRANYWVEWLLDYAKLCKKRKQPCHIQKRDYEFVDSKYQRNIVWLIWDAIQNEANERQSNIIIKVIWCYYNLSKAIKLKIISQKELVKFNTNKDFFVYQQKQDIYGNNVIREKIGERSIHWVPEIQY